MENILAKMIVVFEETTYCTPHSQQLNISGQETCKGLQQVEIHTKQRTGRQILEK